MLYKHLKGPIKSILYITYRDPGYAGVDMIGSASAAGPTQAREEGASPSSATGPLNNHDGILKSTYR